MTSELEITSPALATPVSGLLDIPGGATAMLALAHGAGAGMRHPFMEALAAALAARRVATLRYQFPYMEKGSRRPDSPKLLTATVAAAVEAARAAAPELPLFAGGKSMGGRMTTTAAAEGLIARPSSLHGIVCFGFPLHPAKKPATARAAHLAKVKIPTLFLQGTRDDLADTALMRQVVAGLPDTFQIHELAGADHGFAVLKSSGRTNAAVLDEAADVAAAFIRDHC